MKWQTTRQSTRPMPRGLGYRHVAAGQLADSKLMFVEGTYDPHGGWRG